MDFVGHWSRRTGFTQLTLVVRLGIAPSKDLDWKQRYGRANEHNRRIPRDFKSFVREVGLDHVRTSPCNPQSNGKKERFLQALKVECLRPGTPHCLEDARRLVTRFVAYYDGVRLHSAIGYVTPTDMHLGRADTIHAARDRKLKQARARRRIARATEVA